MARTLELTPDELTLEHDPTFRREVVDNVLEAAQEKGVLVDRRCRLLLEQYAAVAISCVELHHEIGRPILH